MKSHRILLADDHTIVIEGLRRILEPRFEIVGVAADGLALVSAARTLRPDIIVVDISMPLLNGIDAVGQIRKFDPDVKIIFLTMHSDVTYATEALAAGGSAYVLKISAGEEILAAIEAVFNGITYVTPSISAAVARALRDRENQTSGPHVVLTNRQREVLQLLAEGKSLKEAAEVLNVSTRTVEFHKYQIMRKLGLHTNAEITKYAVKLGITQL